MRVEHAYGLTLNGRVRPNCSRSQWLWLSCFLVGQLGRPDFRFGHEVDTSAKLGSEERRAVLADNALKLFPRLAARAPAEKGSAQTLQPKSIS
jgi:hypothetical protein